MFVRRLVFSGAAVAAALLSPAALAERAIGIRLVGPATAIGVSDPLLAIESNRSGIVNRLLADHAEALAQGGVSPDAFRRALESLRADQLLAASLVNSFGEVTAIIAQQPSTSDVMQRFVAIAPRTVADSASLSGASAYLVRDGERLSVVDAGALPFLAQGQVVGYFSSPPTLAQALGAGRSTSTTDDGIDAVRKDGPGSGANSWIGYTAGNNVASGTGSAVAAGTFNAATATNASVFAGQSNSANGISSVVVGGFDNHALVIDSTVVGGAGNRAQGARSVIIGGGYNLATGQWSFIGGGGRQTGSGNAGAAAQDHVVSGNWAGIAGGIGNRVSGNYAFVGGGAYNSATNNGAVVVGGNNGQVGQGNTASGLNAFVGAGFLNVASGSYAAIFAGHESTASGDGAVILGGHGPAPGLGNVASGQSALVTTGYSNVASGDFASVVSAHDSVAAGTGSIAIGVRALTQSAGAAAHDGAFVFSDGSSGNFRSPASHTFNVLATGGASVVTAATNTAGEAVPTAGVTIGAGGGSWTSLSDRAAKRDLLSADPEAVLEKVAAMPIYTWRYITERSGASHMGPMAQDFYQAFSLGDSDKTITNVDADGVALAAIQGLKQLLDRKDAQLRHMELELEAIKARLDRR
ncbi:MAG TPA: tail fiber domain-containing protein [Casimicrobiaceae bacterium]|nr:tail fiber domain-containing protein [Casimicrobiaceae bacterium]